MYHSQAYERLLTHHKSWICAYGELPWQEYLQLVAKKNETGEWIKEVIQAELKEKLGK